MTSPVASGVDSASDLGSDEQRSSEKQVRTTVLKQNRTTKTAARTIDARRSSSCVGFDCLSSCTARTRRL
jgi:hypothetical protein